MQGWLCCMNIIKLGKGNVLRSVCLFVCHQCVLIGYWSDWRSTTILLAAISGCSTAEPFRQVAAISAALTSYIYKVKILLHSYLSYNSETDKSWK